MDTERLEIPYKAHLLLETPPIYEGYYSKVYRAQDLELRRTVGVKAVDYQTLPRADQRSLLSEVTVWCDYAAKSKKMPQIFNGLRYGGKYYLIMQWIEGQTLRTHLDRGDYSPGEKLNIALQLCEALTPIHRMRKQHRDLKPENLQIDRNGQLYLLDFNIASSIPHVGVGTDGYLAPEVGGISAQSNTTRVDIFSLGVILYEMFTGCIPVFGMDYVCAPTDQIWQVFAEPREKDPGIPLRLNEIIRKCMALQSRDRYQNAQAVQRDLRQVRLT